MIEENKREYIDLRTRWGFTGHPSACVLYTLLRGGWNQCRVSAYSDHDSGDEFYVLAREFNNVTDAAVAEHERLGCWCVPGQTPDDGGRSHA